MVYADIIIDISHEKVDRTFSYRVPDELADSIEVGSAVVIPFGRGDTARTGYVVGLSYDPPAGIETSRIKPIMGLQKGALPIESQLVALAAWMRSHYGSTMTRALRTVIPVKRAENIREKKYVRCIVSAERLREEQAQLLSRKRHSAAKERLFAALAEEPERSFPWELLTGELQITSQAIRDLERDGVVAVSSTRSYRNPIDAFLGKGDEVGVELPRGERVSVNEIAYKAGDSEGVTDEATEANQPCASAGGCNPPEEQQHRRVGGTRTGARQGYTTPIILNPEQRAAIEAFREGRRQDAAAREVDSGAAPHPFLLFGITGSGKTEVYIEMIRDVLAEGRQAIVLIPEIALTYQTVMRFYRQFGDRVSFLNSRMSAGERYDQYERAKKGELDVMVGPRSALFTAFPDLGLIIIDEEHETSYASEQPPRYHARETAEERARLAGAALVLGSATPSLESYSRVAEGRYRLLTLTERAVAEAVLPRTEIVDLRAELRSGNRSILSRRLQQAISDRLARGEQSMLFLNRRGLAGFVSCRACGEAIRCPHCDVTLSEHRDGRLYCHYCGYNVKKPPVCPSCGSKYIGGFRAGTQKVEEEVHRLFPSARLLRMDADTTQGKDGHREILAAFSDGQADILIGTQMIVKGHDFANVTLMGILAADQALNAQDFRSAERCYDLLVQAAGRAGRGSRAGDVIIQTYQPSHYAITAAAAGDYGGFYRQEIAYRDLMGYPPHSHILTFLVTGEAENETDAAAAVIAKRLRERFPEVFVAGPHSAGIGKLRDIYRRIVYVKHDDYERLVAIKDDVEPLTREDARFAHTQLFTVFDEGI